MNPIWDPTSDFKYVSRTMGNMMPFSFKESDAYKTYYFYYKLWYLVLHIVLRRKIEAFTTWNNLVIPKFSVLHWLMKMGKKRKALCEWIH